MRKGPPYDDWDLQVYEYASRHADRELRRSKEEDRRRPTNNNAAVVGHYMGVLHRMRSMVYDRIEELEHAE